MLSEEDLKQPPLNLDILGDIKRLSYNINSLRFELKKNIDPKTNFCLSSSNISPLKTPNQLENLSFARRSNTFDSTSSDDESLSPLLKDSDELSSPVCTSCHARFIVNHSNIAKNLNPERWKTAIALLYALFVSWLTAVVMTIVHDRVPDMNKYPPLPDIILDNMPHVPWAFEMTELTGMTLLLIWFIMIICHKHRFIIARRCFAIGGTVFLLRCFTMLITSLSVPGVHLDCKPRPYGSWASRLHEAYIIWSGAGMSLQGVRTCGDYMFSGHTVSLTLLNFFITEYTSRRIFFLHTFTWLCNCFGVFFILAAHEHYSIDVFVAFYITSRLFLYYHTLVNNRAVSKYQESFDAKRTWFYFPMFSFLEQNVDGRIPNVFELPLAPQDVSDAFNSALHGLKNKFNDFQNANERLVQRKDKKKAKHN